MKKLLLSAVTVSVLAFSAASQASWFGNNDWGPWGGNGWGNDWNPYDEWDPRYWIREMDNEFADDYYGPGPYGYGPGPYGYGPGPYGYGPGPYGYGGPAPYGYAPPPAPYGYAPPPAPPAPAQR